MSEELKHYGTKYESGRYPYGSGENPFQHDKLGFYREYKTLKDKGMSEAKIKKYFDDKYFGGQGKFNTSVLRNYITVGREQQEKENITRVLYLRDEKKMSPNAISKEMGVPERTVYSWLDPSRKEKLSKTRAVAEAVKGQVERYAKDGKYLDVGKATEYQLGCSRTQLNAAISILQDEGYKIQYLSVKQVGTGKNTSVKVLTKDDVEYKDLVKNMDKVTPVEGIQPAKDASYFKKIDPPVSIKSDRIAVKYAEDGGADRDGMIEIRPGVEDLSLGDNNYCQIRIAVDGDHYIKGMAVYSNNIPKGKDILINSNKSVEKGLYGSLKEMEKVKKNGVETDEIDMDRPFGATVKRANTYIGADGKEHQSAINIVNDDTDWDKWSRNLPSQFLSKQNKGLAKRQLQLAYDAKEQEFEDINSLTNPTLKKKLLEEFADSCDSAAVTLKAAPLPRQSTHVLLPLTEIKDNEIYAPNYKDGEEVILVRFPHEGTFQIPRLKVNNKNKQGKEYIGPDARNAVGISAKTAEQLSGADFDGDTVMVIPTKGQDLKSSKPLKQLEGFDTKASYGTGGDTSVLRGFHKQLEMGKISNLITDMTIAGAPESDLAMATKYSMTVIDTEKHKLDWRRAYKDCNIAYLNEKYRGDKNKGASTLISQASSETHPNARRLVTSANDKSLTDKERKDFLEGKKVYKETGEAFLKSNIQPKDMTEKQLEVYRNTKATFKKTGEIPENNVGLKFTKKYATDNSTKMADTEDAFTLSSGTPMETIYATHANKLKKLANNARKEALMTQPIKYSPTAKKAYAHEVESLNNKLKTAQLNNPLERQAQMIANKTITTKMADDPSLKTDKDSLKKVKNRALADARARVGAKKEEIKIEPKEWEAIQAGAVSNNKLTQIFANTNDEKLKTLAMPKNKKAMSKAQISRAKRLLEAGNTYADVAETFGISSTTLSNLINKK
jgi:hypothetical protein